VNAAAKLLDRVLQHQVQAIVVAISKEDLLAGIAAQDDMVDCAGEMYAGFACHGGIMPANSR